MDPNANIEEQRVLARELIDLIDQPDSMVITPANVAARNAEIIARAERLAELVQVLDEWRTNGGFDPYKPSADEHQCWCGADCAAHPRERSEHGTD